MKAIISNFAPSSKGSASLRFASGLAFAGVASSRVNATFSSQTIGTSPLSIVITFLCPLAPPSSGTPALCVLSQSSTGAGANALGIRFLTSGNLQVIQRNSSGGTAATAEFANFIQNYAGQAVEVAFVKDASGNVFGFINGTPSTINVTLGTGSFNQTVASTDFNLGIFDASDVFTGVIYQAGFFNRALSIADAALLYASGVNQSDFFASMATQTSNSPSFLVQGARYRIETFVSGDSFGGTVTNGTANTTGCEFIYNGTATWTNGSTLRRIGAMVWLPLDENYGRQAQSVSAFDSNASIIGNGITWAYPFQHEGVLLWRASVNTGQNIIATSESIPTDAIVTSVTVENVTLGTGQTVSLGFSTTGTPTDIINAGAIGGNGSYTTFFPQVGAPASGNLRVSFSASGTIRLTINFLKSR